MLPLVVPKTVAVRSSLPQRAIRRIPLGLSDKERFLFVVCIGLLIAMVISHAVAIWIKLAPHATYRRVGPESGPQVFCAGSSLLEFGLSWPEVSEQLGQGIESWGVAGSTSSEWEVFQGLAKNTDLMIIGVDVYDLNEQRFCDARADIVPMMQTIEDLWHSGSDWQLAKRSLSQYSLSWLRKLFPTAGRSDGVIWRLRRKLPRQLRLSSAVDEEPNSLIVPREAVMNFGESTQRVSDWPKSKLLRRLALMRNENRDMHVFNGPKKLAFQRMLLRAQRLGRVIVVVLPVSPAYGDGLVTPEVLRDFQDTLVEAQQVCPQAEFVRLDQLPGLNSNDYYLDLVHLNGAGRRIATEAFLNWLSQSSRKP
jgi:hypothetical protein